MTEDDGPPLERLLLHAVDRYAALAPEQVWVDERDRWLELVVCVLFTHAIDGDRARRVVSILDQLGLLDIDALADSSEECVALRAQILTRCGVPPGATEAVELDLSRLATDLHRRYEGHVQLYLRQHAQRMLAELPREFPAFVGKDAERAQHALALWLQNVASLPVFLDTPAAQRFMEEVGASPQELHDAADRLGINAALLDDILDLWWQEQVALIGPSDGS